MNKIRHFSLIYPAQAQKLFVLMVMFDSAFDHRAFLGSLGPMSKCFFNCRSSRGEIGYLIENYLANKDFLDLPDDYQIGS